MPLRPLPVALAVSAATLLALPAAAPAKPKRKPSGITVVAPEDRATVEAGHRITFRLRVRGKRDKVFIHVSKSRRRRADGTIGRDVAIGQARRRGKEWRWRVRYFDYPRFWLNRPGAYYWQAYRVRCDSARDCRREGPIVRLRLRRG